MLIRSMLLVVAMGIFLNLSPGIALAQTGQPPVERSTPTTYSEGELKSFAEILLEVQRINNAYLPSLVAAKSPEDENRIREAATGEAEHVISEKGISMDKYREILFAALNNSELADRIRQHILSLQ